MAAQGYLRYRKHQFGRQASFGTPIAAAAAYAFTGTPDPDLAWTDRDVEVGSIDEVAAPTRGAPNLTAALTSPGVEYNDLPLMFAAMFGGGETGTPEVGGTSVAWGWAPASLSVDAIVVFTYEFGDDVVTDWFQFGDGILESLELAGPEGLGPFTAAMQWRFGSLGSSGSTDLPDSPTVPTADLEVDPNAALWYLKDTGLYIASDPDDLSTSLVADALHSLSLKVTVETDQKRYAQATQSFDISAYGRTRRMIELSCVFAKTSDTVGTGSESDAWMSDTSVTRYAEIKATSKELASTSPDVPYSVDLVMPLRYRTRSDGASGGNSTVTLMGRAFYDPTDFEGVFTADVVCSRVSADL